MYSYMFGAIFMGIASLYFVIKKQTSEFIIPQEVSTLLCHVKYPNCINLISLAVGLCSCLCRIHQFCALLSAHDLVQSSSLLHTGHLLLASAGIIMSSCHS